MNLLLWLAGLFGGHSVTPSTTLHAFAGRLRIHPRFTGAMVVRPRLTGTLTIRPRFTGTLTITPKDGDPS